MSPLPVVIEQQNVISIDSFHQRVDAYIRASRAPNTMRGYRSDWADFSLFCHEHGVDSLPASPATVCSYLAAVADRGLKAGSIQRRVSSISAMHAAAGMESPTAAMSVRLTLAGIRRTLGTAQTGKAPVMTSDLAAMTSHIQGGLLGIRDRALLLIGFGGAFRRSELVDLDITDLEFSADGVKILIRRSKTDQEGEGQQIAIARGNALCPVAAIEAWIAASGINTGPLFRAVDRHGRLSGDRLGDRAVAEVVKRYATAAGLDGTRYAGHSLRAGLVSQGVVNRVDLASIQRQTRHKSLDMLLRYSRSANLFAGNCSAQVGL